MKLQIDKKIQVSVGWDEVRELFRNVGIELAETERVRIDTSEHNDLTKNGGYIVLVVRRLEASS